MLSHKSDQTLKEDILGRSGKTAECRSHDDSDTASSVVLGITFVSTIEYRCYY